MHSTSSSDYKIVESHIWYDGPLFATLERPDGLWWAIALAGDDEWICWRKDDPACELDQIREVQKKAKCFKAILRDEIELWEPILEITEEHLVGEGADFLLSRDGAQKAFDF